MPEKRQQNSYSDPPLLSLDALSHSFGMHDWIIIQLELGEKDMGDDGGG